MSRKGQAPKRNILPDPKFKDKVVAKFINRLMWEGKKSVAERIFYNCLDILQEKSGGEEGIKVFKKALDSVKPTIEVRSRRVGGANYQVPSEVRPERRLALGMTWIIQCARVRSEKNMEQRLAGELLDAINSRGAAIKKRDDVHKMAEANRAFAHFKF